MGVAHIYVVLQIVLKKSLSCKKRHSRFKRAKNWINFFIHSKKVNFWPRKASFKAFASLRLQSEAFRGQKNAFFSCEKMNYCFWPVFREKNTIYIALMILHHPHRVTKNQNIKRRKWKAKMMKHPWFFVSYNLPLKFWSYYSC